MKDHMKYVAGLSIGVGLLTAVAQADEIGGLYTMDNSASGNHVLAFRRDSAGGLTPAGSFASGGTGSGTAQGLPSQGSILLTPDNRWLFVSNAGSSEISVFNVAGPDPVLTDKISSGGRMPVSLALHRNLLYVLNAGGLAGDQDNITAFIFIGGKLVALPGSTRALSEDNTGPAQVSFTHDGDALVVTERVTSLIDTFALGQDGMAIDGQNQQSVGATPFGFDFGREDQLFVSETAVGTVSSYKVGKEGELSVVSGAAPTAQAAPCWLITSVNGRFAYTANAGSGSLSGFSIGPDGSLSPLDSDGRTGVTGDGSHPADLAQSRDGRFLYSLNNGNGTISVFRVEPSGGLQPVATVSGLPITSTGLAGR